ncbi:MAG: hypothetical protein IT561_22045, partial [Alphaproteobacteria bacterium]|nr:hypothetical protein [Alphaproteobacteria bacterium]
IDAMTMIRLATGFVRHRAHGGRPVVITNDVGRLAGLTDVAVIARPTGDPAGLLLDRIRAYRDYVAAQIGIGDACGAVFVDTDVLALRDLAPLFDLSFDVALTVRSGPLERPVVALDRWGLPRDARPAPVNSGVMAVRFNARSLAFLDATLDRFTAIVAEGTAFLTDGRNSYRTGDGKGRYRIADVRTWGGDQFALTSLLSEHLFANRTASCTVAGAAIVLLPDATWNFTPKERLTPEMLDGRFILHLKGNKKSWMAPVARWFGITA